jgi:hypothetical protein
LPNSDSNVSPSTFGELLSSSTSNQPTVNSFI